MCRRIESVRPIIVKEPFRDGYVEAIYQNHNNVLVWRFEPDPRKKQCKRPKYWTTTGTCGTVDQVVDSARDMGQHVIAAAKEEYLHLGIAMERVVLEAARRYDQRYAHFGELANAAMPPDPEVEAMFAALAEIIEGDISRIAARIARQIDESEQA
jgi:hypothetical protein